MKYAVLYDGKLYIADDKWVTIRGKNGVGRPVLIKGDGEQENKNSDPEQISFDIGMGRFETVKRGKPMTHEEADSKRPNPMYESNYLYRINCQVCVLAYEMRRRGYNVEATAFRSFDKTFKDLEYDPGSAFIGMRARTMYFFPTKEEEKESEGFYTVAKSFKRVYKAIKSGGRYYMDIEWRDGGGHVVVVEKIKGKLRVYDPQDGSTYVGAKELRENLLKNVEFVKPYRVDDKQIDVNVVSKVLKESYTAQEG